MTALMLTGANRGRDRLDWAQLSAMRGAAEDVAAVAEGAVGTAVPASMLVAAADPDPEVRYCTVISRDGSYRASIPLDDLTAGGWLAFRLGDEPLPADRGGPLRLTVAKGRTLCWNVKDVGELRFTEDEERDDVPARPSH